VELLVRLSERRAVFRLFEEAKQRETPKNRMEKNRVAVFSVPLRQIGALLFY
jgi:hypothetical protein